MWFNTENEMPPIDMPVIASVKSGHSWCSRWTGEQWQNLEVLYGAEYATLGTVTHWCHLPKRILPHEQE